MGWQFYKMKMKKQFDLTDEARYFLTFRQIKKYYGKFHEKMCSNKILRVRIKNLFFHK